MQIPQAFSYVLLSNSKGVADSLLLLTLFEPQKCSDLSIPSYIHYNHFEVLYDHGLQCFSPTHMCDEYWHEQWERNLSYCLMKEECESCVVKCRFKSPQHISLASVVPIKCFLGPILKVFSIVPILFAL